MKTLIRLAAAAGLLFAPLAFGGVSPQEAAHLGEDLTPLGGEKAANADGSIPAWTGGIRSAAEAGFPNYKSGDHHPDPYANDKPLFTITSANLAQYAAKLTEGHKALFKTYPDYKMIVYPTHRSAAVPDHVAEATKRNATSASLVPERQRRHRGDRRHAVPDPEVGPRGVLEPPAALPRRRCRTAGRAGGAHRRWQLHGGQLQGGVLLPVLRPGHDGGGAGERAGVFPAGNHRAGAPRRGSAAGAGDARSDQGRAPRLDLQPRPAARAPCAAGGLRQPGNQFRQPAHRRPVRHVQRQPRALRLEAARQAGDLRPVQRLPAAGARRSSTRDLLHKNHINQDYARYELHRVWVVDATLKTGFSHIYSRRTLYVDEDSWQILAVDCYDIRAASSTVCRKGTR